MTVAVGLAAAGKAFHQRRAQAVRRELKLGPQPAFELAQGQRGLARGGVNLCHIILYGKDNKTMASVTKENMVSKCESAHSPENTGPSGSFQKLMRNRCLFPRTPSTSLPSPASTRLPR